MFKALTLRGWLMIAAAAFLLGAGGFVVAHFMGWRLHIAEGQRDTARDNAQRSGLETKGGQDIAHQQQTGQDALDAQREGADKLNKDAANDPNAQTPIPDTSADRLRRGDHELCGLAVKCRP